MTLPTTERPLRHCADHTTTTGKPESASRGRFLITKRNKFFGTWALRAGVLETIRSAAFADENLGGELRVVTVVL